MEPVLSTHHSKPGHCPLCSRHASSAQYSEYDDLTLRYGVAKATLYKLNDLTTNNYTTYGSMKQMLNKLNLVPTPYVPLTVHCNTCHSTYRFHVAEPHVSNFAPRYCTYCGAETLHMTQDHDQDYIEVIASAYNLPPKVITVMLTMFGQQAAYSHFADFVAAIKGQLASA